MRIITRCLLVSFLSFGCGPSDLDPEANSSPIINGFKTAWTFNYAGALVIETPVGWSTFCSGTLISKTMVLSAAHCFDKLPPGAKIGFLWGATAKVSNPVPYIIKISKYHIHPKWAGGAPAQLSVHYDIAVAILSKASSNKTMKMVRPKEVSTLVKTGAGVVMIGYGQSIAGDSSSSGTKYHGVSTIGPVGTHELYVVAKTGGAHVCSGDSGGPVLGDLDTTKGWDFRLVGVASRTGKGCIGGSYNTRVDAYLTWIHTLGTIPCGSGLSADCTTPPPPPPPPPKKKLGEKCTKASECAGGLCISYNQEMVCSQSCSLTADSCPSGYVCSPIQGSSTGACVVAPTPPPPPPVKKAFGEKCQFSNDCQSSLCALSGTLGFCTVRCSDTAPCPKGYLCKKASNQSICAPGTAPPPPPPPPTPTIPERKGCAVAGPDAARQGLSFILPLLLFVLISRRRTSA